MILLAELAARAEPLVSVEDIGHCIECEEAISRDVMREMGMFVVDSLYDIWSLKRLWFWLQQQYSPFRAGLEIDALRFEIFAIGISGSRESVF